MFSSAFSGLRKTQDPTTLGACWEDFVVLAWDVPTGAAPEPVFAISKNRNKIKGIQVFVISKNRNKIESINGICDI